MLGLGGRVQDCCSPTRGALTVTNVLRYTNRPVSLLRMLTRLIQALDTLRKMMPLYPSSCRRGTGV